MFDFNKYTFVTYKDKNDSTVTAALSSYAGKTVKGYAKLHPEDNYDEEIGRKLAAARCNEKVAKKRMKHAEKQVLRALKQVEAANKYLKEMELFHNDTMIQHFDATAEITEILNQIKRGE